MLAVDSARTDRRATLGNDVNLRDIEGRSALLLGEAKDNNASCAIGPLIRLFDEAGDGEGAVATRTGAPGAVAMAQTAPASASRSRG